MPNPWPGEYPFAAKGAPQPEYQELDHAPQSNALTAESPSGVMFTIVLPCFNERGAVADTIAQLRTLLATDLPYEIVAVNDGSSDGSGEILNQLAGCGPRLRVLHHDRNRGYGAALKTGIRGARGRFIAITDADGTYPNERLPELVLRCRDVDMVVGARVGADVAYSRLRALPKAVLRFWVSWIAGRNVPDINSGMRVFRRDAAEPFIGIFPDGFSFTITITLAMLTTYRSVEFVPVGYRRRVGRSKIQPIRDTLRFAGIILRTGIYFAPLRAFAPVILALGTLAAASLARDVFRGDLTEATLLLFLFTMNAGMFTLLADMIDKRMAR